MPTHDQNETISTLLAAGTVEATDELRTISQSADDKETRKAAKRALYLLSQKGIEPPPIVRHVSFVVEPEYRLLQTKATVVDGAGNQLLWSVFASPDGGNPTLFSALVSDEEGVKDYVASRMSRRELDAQIKSTAEVGREGVSFADVEPEYIRRRLAEAITFSRTHWKTTPPGFLDWAKRVGTPDNETEPSDALIWQTYSKESIAEDSEIDRDPAHFFEIALFESWFLDARALELAAHGWGMLKDDVLAPTDKPTLERVMEVAFEAALPPEKIRDYARRLANTATILHCNGGTEQAKMALAHALTLENVEDPAQNPFLRALMERSLDVALDLLIESLASRQTNARPTQ